MKNPSEKSFVVVAAAIAALGSLFNASTSVSATGATHSRLSPSTLAGTKTIQVIGYSVDHRPIVAFLIGPAHARRTMLVVGSIAGDEPGGTAVTQAIASLAPIARVKLWLVPDINPDGAARGRRVNADGVDLNRNFPYRWHHLAKPGSRYYSGTRPGSEPESRAIEAFIRRIRPGLSVWLHQPYSLIDDSQGPRWAEQLLARTIGLPLERLPDYPGSAIGWENHIIHGSAFDLELPGAQLTGPIALRYADAIRLLAHTFALSTRLGGESVSTSGTVRRTHARAGNPSVGVARLARPDVLGGRAAPGVLPPTGATTATQLLQHRA